MNAPLNDLTVLEEITANCPDHGEFKRYRTKFGVHGQCEVCERIGRERQEAETRARQRAENIERLMDESWLPPRFEGKSFDSYRPQNKAQKSALATCRKYVDDLPGKVESGSCLVLIGQHGVGKTHLLTSIVSAAIQRQCPSRYTTMVSFLAAVKGSWAWHGAEFGEDFTEPSLLVLDELWIPQSGRDRESLLALLDERYRAGDPTLIGSNLTWPQMEQELGMRFCDRLLEGGGQVVAIEGKSMRTATNA